MMNKCKRCNKETNNSYSYYRSKPISSGSTSYKDSTSGDTHLYTKTFYDTFILQSDYCCTKCAVQGELTITSFGTFIFGLLGLFFLVLALIVNLPLFWIITITTIVMFAFCIRDFLKYMKLVKNDVRVADKLAVKSIVMAIRDKGENHYFLLDKYTKID